MSSMNWHIITPHCPPYRGGVSDYTGLVAVELAKRGQSVNIWTSQMDSGFEGLPGAEKSGNVPGVHRVVPSWNSAVDLQRLSSMLDQFPGPRTLLIQHTPQIWGRAGVNFRVPAWVESRHRQGDQIFLMVHEAAYPFLLFDRPTRWPLHAIHVHVLKKLLKSSDHVYASCESFLRFIQRHDPRPARPCSVLPVPSNIPVVNDPQSVRELRERLVPATATIVGSFGPFGPFTPPDFCDIVARILSKSQDRYYFLLGIHGERFADKILQKNPSFKDRLIVTGSLEANQLSMYLQTCDLMIQLYSDGPSTRRSTLMACASHGKAVITGDGPNSDTIWSQGGCIALCPSSRSDDIIPVAERLIENPQERDVLAFKARQLYQDRLDLSHMVQKLIKDVGRI